MYGSGICEYLVPRCRNCGWIKSACQCARVDVKPIGRNVAI